MWFSDQNTYFKFGRSVQSRCRLAGFTKNSTITLCFDIPFKLKKKLLYNTI